MSTWSDKIEKELRDLRAENRELKLAVQTLGAANRERQQLERQQSQRARTLPAIPILLFDQLGAADGAASASQPVNANLTAISALTTTAYGLALLELINAAGLRTAAALGTAAVEDTIAPQADSVAIVLADLVTDFNALLAKMRTSGVLQP